jgi:hypothetical protein
MFGAEVVPCSNYLLNRVSSRVVWDVSPLEKWSGRKLSTGHLKNLGCVSWACILDEKQKKLDPIS